MKIFLSLLLGLVYTVCTAQKPELMIPAGHADDIRAIIVTPDNKYIVSADGDATTKIWEKASGRLVFNFPFKENGKPYRFSQFIFRKNGKELLAAGINDLVIFDFESFSILKELPLGNFTCATLASDDNTLYLSSHNERYRAEITKINLDDFSSATIYSISDPDKYDLKFSRISLSADESRLLCYTQLNGSSLIDTNGTLIKIFPSSNSHAVWCFAADGSLVDIEEKGLNQNIIKFLDPQTGNEKWQATVQFKSNFSFYYSFQTAVFDKQNGVWVLASSKSFAVLDYVNQKVLNVYEIPKGEVSSIGVSPVSNEYIIGTTMNSGDAVYLYSYDVTKNKVSDNFGTAVLSPWSIKTPMHDKTILIGSFQKYFKQVDISKASFVIKNLAHNYGSEKIGISADGKTGVSAASEFINFYQTNDAGDDYTEVNTEDNTSSPNEIVFSKDDKLMASINTEETVIINVAMKKVLYRYKTGTYAMAGKQGLGKFSNDNKKLITYSINEGSIPTITCFSIALGKVIWTKPGDIYSFHFSADDSNIFCINHDNNKALWLNAQNGSIMKEKTFDIKGGAIENTIVTNDSKYALINVESKIEIWNLETFEKTGELKGHTNRVNYTAFLEDEKYLISSSYDNTIRLWDWKNQKELCRFILFEESESWVALMPDGRFDASEDVLKKMYYVRGKEIIPLENLYEQFYTPMLVNRIFNSEQFKPLDIDINTIKQKPIVKINYAAIQRNLEVSDDTATYENTTGAAEITVTANAKDDAVDEIRLFQNGKILNLATRNLIVADDKTTIAVKKYTITLLPGVNNIRAVGLNTQRTESAPDEITVIYKQYNSPENIQADSYNSDEAISSVDKNATLHLVVIGINAYKNPTMSLNYALADATAFKNEVEKDARSVITNIRTYFVTDNDADKSGITTALQQVQANAKPQDLFIFYYAGHGVINNSSKEFYLVPNDVTDLKNVDEALKEHGIAAKLLQQYAINIQAQKQLFILDACQSAGAFETLITNDANQQKTIAVVARSTGTHWIAASGAQQFANEFSQLGHGAFTYVLLQALKGEAANNNMITVNGLKHFLQLKVPALMKQYNGSQQSPASYGYGNDFPVEVIK